MERRLSRKIRALTEKIKQLESENVRLRNSIHPIQRGYRDLMAHMSEGVCIHELVYTDKDEPADYRILEINDRFAQILGLSREQVIGRLSTEAYGTEKPPYFDTYVRVAETGHAEMFQSYFPPMKKYFSVSVFSLGGRIFATVFFDITELKEKELDVRRSEDNLRITLNSIGDAVIATDAEGRVRRMNPRAEKLTGWTLREAEGRPLGEVFHIINALSGERAENPVGRVLETGKVVGLANHTILLSRGGEKYHIADSGAPIRNGGEEIKGVVLVFRDVTESYRKNRELRESEERLRHIFTNVPVGIFRTTLDGRVLEVNDEMARILGYRESREVVDNFTDLSRQLYVDPTRREEFLAQLLEKKEVLNFEYEGRRVDGKHIWISMNARIGMDHTGNTTVIDGFAQDVTFKKQAEEALRVMVEERETLLRELYHRTKNNMQVIASMLSLKRFALADGETRSVLQELEGKIYSMALVHQKLYKSQNLSRIDLKEYILELGDLVLNTFGFTGERIEIDYRLEAMNVLIDTAIPIGLVLNEVILNSLKHAFPEGEGGIILIRLRRADGDRVRLEIGDNGIGMPEWIDCEDPDSLGLQTVKNIVENQLGGVVSYERDGGTNCILDFSEKLYNERV